jgi:hypothetical protein
MVVSLKLLLDDWIYSRQANSTFSCAWRQAQHRLLHRARRGNPSVIKAELHRQIDVMTEEEAAEVKLIYAPDWPSKATSIEEIRKRAGTTPMSHEHFDRHFGFAAHRRDGYSAVGAGASPRFEVRVVDESPPRISPAAA